MKCKDKVILVKTKLYLSQAKLGILQNLSLASISRWVTSLVQPSKKDKVALVKLDYKEVD